MLGLSFGEPATPLKILCLGAHADDIEIGCGASVLELLATHPDVRITWIVFSGAGPRAKEARRSAQAFLKRASSPEIRLRSFRDGFFPGQLSEIKEFFEELKGQISPDLILTHHRHDRHQDHRVISDLTWNTWRNHLVLEYEIPKYDGDLGIPNLFVPVSVNAANRKTKTLCSVFQTQGNRHWFTPDVFLGLMRIRGLESCAPSGYAEAFHSRKVIVVPGDRSRSGGRRRRSAAP